MSTMLRATLVAVAAMATMAIVAGGAFADDDDDHGKRSGRHGDKACKVLTVEVTAGQTLIVTGEGLVRWSRRGVKPPKVWFGGVSAPVLEFPEPTRETIVVDVKGILAALEGPKNVLLEIKRSREDDACPSHLVTVVPRDKKAVFVTSAAYDGAFSQAPGQCLGEIGFDRADCICNGLAAGASPPLAGQFVAWLSGDDFSAPERLPADGGPWYNLDPEGRQLVAATRSDLPGSGCLLGGYCIEHAIGFTENGDAPAAAVWTGVLVGNPLEPQTCHNWESSSSGDTGWVGDSSESKTRWTSGDIMTCDQPYGHLYCFQR